MALDTSKISIEITMISPVSVIVTCNKRLIQGARGLITCRQLLVSLADTYLLPTLAHRYAFQTRNDGTDCSNESRFHYCFLVSA